jgi:capsular polysaccharide biosynthesis protein
VVKNVNNETNNQQDSIDLVELFHLILKNSWIIIAVTLIFGLAIGFYTKYGIDKKYESNTMIAIIVNKDENSKETSENFRVATELAKRYSIIAKSNTVLENVRDDLRTKSIDLSVSQLSAMFTVQSINDTDILKLTVTYTDPDSASVIADTITEYGNASYQTTYENDSIKLIDSARIQPNPISPNLIRNVIIGVAIGGMLSVGFVLLKEFLNHKIRTAKDLEMLGIPYMGSIVDITKLKK